tara:strand:- start:238 stop:1092 length:855 start_codon:yes stop_codon:yes gene_type:complete
MYIFASLNHNEEPSDAWIEQTAQTLNRLLTEETDVDVFNMTKSLLMDFKNVMLWKLDCTLENMENFETFPAPYKANTKSHFQTMRQAISQIVIPHTNKQIAMNSNPTTHHGMTTYIHEQMQIMKGEICRTQAQVSALRGTSDDDVPTLRSSLTDLQAKFDEFEKKRHELPTPEFTEAIAKTMMPEVVRQVLSTKEFTDACASVQLQFSKAATMMTAYQKKCADAKAALESSEAECKQAKEDAKRSYDAAQLMVGDLDAKRKKMNDASSAAIEAFKKQMGAVFEQ